jgi:hypothetical protein
MTDRYMAADQVRLMETESGALLLNLRTNSYYSLEATGLHAWRSLCDGRTPVEVAALLAVDFDVTVPTASDDVRRLLDELLAEGLLQPDAR